MDGATILEVFYLDVLLHLPEGIVSWYAYDKAVVVFSFNLLNSLIKKASSHQRQAHSDHSQVIKTRLGLIHKT